MSNSRDLDKKVTRAPSHSWEDYLNSFDQLLNYCKIIKKQKDTKCVKCDHIADSHNEFNEEEQTLMKNWVLVRLVSLIEFNLKTAFADLIDDLNVNPKRILSEDDISIPLNTLEHFKSEQYTKGRVIIAHFDKMNAGIIKIIMDRINRLDFYKWYSSVTKLQYLHEEDTVTSSDIDKADELVFGLYKKRNDVIHNLVNVDEDVDVEEYVTAFQHLGIHMVIFTKLNIGIIEKHWTDEDAIPFVDILDVESAQKFLREFKKITTKFRAEFSNPVNKATCDDCGDEFEPPFKPREGRPIYCNNCYPKRKTTR